MNKDIEDCAKMLCVSHQYGNHDATCNPVCATCLADAQASARFWLTREVTFEMMKAGSDAEESIELEKPRAFRARLVLNAMRRAQLAELGLDQTEKEKR